MKNIIRLLVCIMGIAYILTAPEIYSQTPRQLTITSGRVNTLGKFNFQYGRLDISVKLPKTADGLWPALRLIETDNNKAPGPDCGEIVLLEMGHFSGIKAGTQDRLYSGAAHWGPAGQDGSRPSHAVFQKNVYGLQHGDFHLFTLIWTPRYIRMYLDLDKIPEEQRDHAIPYFEMEITPELEKYFCKPFYLIMNLAAGGNYTGITGPGSMENISALNKDNKYQAAMYVDYVRVYNEEGKLVFNDEFNGSRLDTAKWNIEANNDDGGSQELQSYRRQNVLLDKDRASGKNCLVLSAKRE